MSDEAFITSLPTTFKNKRRVSSDKLVNVRKDHAQLMDIVKKFGSKVSTMVDNQRIDYMAAYENHMLDVQKELYLLREKVQEIATDGTRDEKIKSLEDAQTKYKSESVLLDQQNNEMRKKLRSLTVTMQSAERDRDWLLGRLRKAKKKFACLESEYENQRSKIPAEESVGGNSNMTSVDMEFSQESSLLLGLYKSKMNQLENGIASRLTPITRPPPKPVWKGRLAATVAVSRSDPFSDADDNYFNRLKGRSMARLSSAPSLYQQTDQPYRRNRHEKNKTEKNTISTLVTMRERKKGVREVIEKCLTYAQNHQASEQNSGFNSLSELVLVCLECTEESNRNKERDDSRLMRSRSSNNEDNDEGTSSGREEGESERESAEEYEQRLENERGQRAWLSSLLTAYPETFMAILDILESKFLIQSSENSEKCEQIGEPCYDDVNNTSQGIINDIANFDSNSWLKQPSDCTDMKKSVSGVNKLKDLKNLRISGSITDDKNYSVHGSNQSNNFSKILSGYNDEYDEGDSGRRSEREVIHGMGDGVEMRIVAGLEGSDDGTGRPDLWGGFTDSIANSLCEEGGDEVSVGAIHEMLVARSSHNDFNGDIPGNFCSSNSEDSEGYAEAVQSIHI